MKTSMLQEEEISETTSKPSPSQDLALLSLDVYSTHYPACWQPCTDSQKIVLISVTLSNNIAVLILMISFYTWMILLIA